MSISIVDPARLDLGLDLPYLNNAAAGSMTVWVRLDSAIANSRSIGGISIGPPPGTIDQSRFQLTKNGVTGLLDFFTQNKDTDAADTLSSAAAFPVGVWTHVAGTYNCDSKDKRLYLNGALDASKTAINSTGTTFSATNAKNGAIGCEIDASDTFNWDGPIEDVRFYDRVLSSTEVATIYSARGADGIVFGLQARYPLNDLGENQTVVNCANLAEFSRRSGTPISGLLHGTSIIRGSRSKRMMGG